MVSYEREYNNGLLWERNNNGLLWENIILSLMREYGRK